jgi:hypothetical protein
MFFSIIFIFLSGINGNKILKDNFNYRNGGIGIFLFYNKNKSNENLKTNSTSVIIWHDIIFILTLIIIFSIFVICLCFQRLLINYLVNLWSKIKSNNHDINEHVTILHQTPPSNNFSSIYLTVPQNTHHYH